MTGDVHLNLKLKSDAEKAASEMSKRCNKVTIKKRGFLFWKYYEIEGEYCKCSDYE